MLRLRVKEIAEEKGVPKAQLGRAANIDAKTLRRAYQHPEVIPSVPILERLAKTLGVRTIDLLEDIPDIP